MMPLTSVVPKPMAPIHGSTLIARKLKELINKVPKIHITIGYKGAELAKHVIENGASSAINTEGKSNSWWIHNSLLSHLDEPIYVLTCDNVAILDFESMERDYREQGSPACLLIGVRPVPGLEGDYIYHDNNVVSKLSRNEPTDLYCSGIQIINPAKVNSLTQPGKDFYDIWDQLMAQQQLKVSSIHPEKWHAIDTLEQLDQFQRLLTSSLESHPS